MEFNNVEHLFETNVISEIEMIEQKLKEEMEKKTEDLKQIVGERYLDLIEVSDSIKLMNDKCNKILNSIDGLDQFLQNHCQNVKLKFKDDQDLCQTDKVILAIEYHIIIETTSKIWSCLDSGEVLTATFFFYQAQSIFKSITDDLSHRTKFLKKYQSTFDEFSDKIIDFCWSSIENVDMVIDETKVALSLICISIIKEINAQELLECFLNRKYNQILALFEKNLNFSQIFLLFFKSIFDISKLVFLIFCDQGSSKSLLFQKASKIPSFNFNRDFQFNSTLSSLMSENIRGLKLEAIHLQKDVSSQIILNLFQNWIKNLKQNVSPKLSEKISCINSIGTIFFLLKEVEEIHSRQDKMLDSEYIFNFLLGHKLNIWECYLKESITQLLKNLIDVKLAQEFQSFKDCLNSVINSNSFSNDILSVVWIDDDDEDNCLNKKIFGVSNNVFDLCKNLNLKLNAILEEMSMIDEKSLSITLIPKQDCEHFKLHFSKTFNYQFQLLLDNFKSYTLETQNLEIILLNARLARALIYFCPNIKACFYLVQENSESAWSKAKETLKNFSYQLFNKYLIQSSQIYIEKLRQDMKPFLFIKFIEISLNWEEIKLEDNLEDGKVINSTIRIPFQISIPIFECINSISSHINLIGAHTIPRKVINTFLYEISLKLNTIYQDLFQDLSRSDKLPSSARQIRALQLYFDLLFFEQLLFNSKNDKVKKEAAQLIHSTLELFKSLIDPFDLHVYFPHLQTALSKSIKSTSLLFGTLFAPTSVTENNNLTQKSAKHEFHNSIAFYCLKDSFPLLNLNEIDKSTLLTSNLN